MFSEFDDEPTGGRRRSRSGSGAVAQRRAGGEIAILYRVNAQSEEYEQALAEKQIPYQVAAASGSSHGPRSAGDDAAARGPTGAGGRAADRGPARCSSRTAVAGTAAGGRSGRWESLLALAEELDAVTPGSDLARFVGDWSCGPSAAPADR